MLRGYRWIWADFPLFVELTISFSLIWLTFTIELNEKNVTYYLLKIFPNLSVNFSVYVVSRASINFYILLQKESISQLIRDTFRNFSFVILLIVYSIIQS